MHPIQFQCPRPLLIISIFLASASLFPEKAVSKSMLSNSKLETPLCYIQDADGRIRDLTHVCRRKKLSWPLKNSNPDSQVNPASIIDYNNLPKELLPNMPSSEENSGQSFPVTLPSP
jgi:hypothetical protein